MSDRPAWLTLAAEAVPLRDLVAHHLAFGVRESLETVHKSLTQQQHEYAAILDGQRVVGLCSRTHVGDRLGLRYGFALFSQAPIAEFLLEKFLVVRETQPMRTVLQAALLRAGEEFDKDVVLVGEDDTYLGMIPVQTLVRVQSQIVTDQLAKLQEQGESLRQSNLELQQNMTQLRDTQVGLQHSNRQLEESGRRFRALVENMHDLVWEIDEYGRYSYVSARSQHLLGYAPQELIGRSLFEIIRPDEVERVRTLFVDQPIAGMSFNAFECIFLHRDGRQLTVESSGEPIRNRAGHFGGYRGVARDVTERKRAAEAHQLLATAVEQSAEAIVVTDIRGAIQYVNPAFEEITGYLRSEVLGQNSRLLKSGRHDAEFYRQMWGVLTAGQVWSGHLINRKKDGTIYEEETTISPVRNAAGKVINYVAVKHDITHEATLEAQLRQSQKMEAIGRLAGGVAHDFNNRLTVITGYCALISQRAAADSGLRHYVEEVQQAAERSAGLTRQLLAFSRRQVLQPRVLNLNEVLHGMEGMLGRLIGEDIELVTDFAANLPSVKADAGQIEQVIMNLAVNARDAMPTGGQLVLSTAMVLQATDSFLLAEKTATAAAYCVVGVRDSGVGMTDQVKAHLFEPFFTTKGPGKGTGLGLATSYGIINQSHGHIRVASNPGKGTTFWIYLPAVAELSVNPGRESTAELPGGGSGTVLVVEDEPSLRELAEVVLTDGGFHVLTASNGAEGLQIVQAARTTVELVITDVIMPQMGGREMVEKIRRTNPDLKVMYISGYSYDTFDRSGEIDASIRFLEKPFTPKQLLSKVHEAFAIRSPAADQAATPIR